MKRRQFIAGLGGAAAWPVVARAQQPDRMRRIGVLIGFGENDPVARGGLAKFTQGLAELGWTNGHNVRVDMDWVTGNVDRMRRVGEGTGRPAPRCHTCSYHSRDRRASSPESVRSRLFL